MQDVIERLFRIGAVRIGEFTLTSGLKSPFYIDLRRIYSYPDLAREIVERLLEKTDLSDIDGVVGIATAGIPLASYIACVKNLPLAYVRIERREHGTMSQVEGDVEGRRVLIVDDVATTGGSIERAVEILRISRANPLKALVIVDREQGAGERLSKIGVRLYRLYTAREIFLKLYEKNYIDFSTLERILRYIEETKSL